MAKGEIEAYHNNRQPNLKAGPAAGVPKYFRGGPKSVARLRNLNYDPIQELVEKYRKLEKEIEYQEKLRSNEIVELTATGKARAYRADQHYALYDKLINIGDKLLRYKYGRVPETDDEGNKSPSPLVINLTKKGDAYVVNEEQPDGVMYEEDDEKDQ
jgi:hypothetical protein